MPCDGNCFACQRPVHQCHGGPAGKTAYTHSSQRPTKKGSGADVGIKKSPEYRAQKMEQKIKKGPCL